jgi:hypothetical protein
LALFLAMSKLNQIQNKLRGIDGAKFQKLCDSYLYKLGCKNIEPFGSMPGKDKTVKGTPDSFIRMPNGNYIFVEYTTKEKSRSNRTGLLNKLNDDLDKCFDEKATGIPPSKIEKIIVCHTSKLSPQEEETLAEKCAEHDCLFEQFGIGKLSLALSQDFPGLAKTFLGVEVDTRQILSPEDFVDEYQKNPFATKLDTAFHFREEELKKIEDSLENKDIVIVVGRAGVGKSRLALECCQQFTEKHPSFKTYCIFNKKLPIYENLKAYFSTEGDYLIFVDDANRVSELEHILYLINDKRENSRVKIIITVRDYALRKVERTAGDYLNKETVFIEPLKNEQIKELVEKECGIRNYRYLDRIGRIAKGNPRLAMMAADVAVKNDNFESIEDASDTYDEYFRTITKDLDSLENKNLLKVAGIIAFFGALDRTDEERFKQIAESFNLSENDLWETAEKLHQFEIVDLYENEVVKASDQILATYLFYKVFFRDEILSFSILLNNYFESYRFDEAVFPVINAFSGDFVYSQLQKHVDKYWANVIDDEPKLLLLADKFWFLKQAETLLYLKEKIDALEAEDYQLSELKFTASKNDVTDVYLKILENFKQARTEDFKIALELISSYLEKRPEILPQVLCLFVEKFCFHVRSSDYGYIVQKTVIDFLIEKATDNSPRNPIYRRFLLEISPKYLRMEFHSSWMEGRRNLSWSNFGLVACPEIFEVRKAIWQFLAAEYSKLDSSKTVLQIISDYSSNIYQKSADENNNAIVKEDAKVLLPFLVANLKPSIYRDCAIVQRYLRFLERHKVRFDKTLKKQWVYGSKSD